MFSGKLNASTNVDTITDFSTTQGDEIRLSLKVFAGLGHTGALTTGEFYAAAGAKAAHDADDRVIYDTASGKLYFDGDGIGGSAAIAFAVIGTAGAAALSAADFLIVA